MPQVTVYIRDQDLPKWKSIEKKSEFMHHVLGEVKDLAMLGEMHVNKFATIYKQPSVTVVEDTFKPKPPDPDIGYPCCTKSKPCKHWLWNELDSTWVNELTGKIRET